MYGKSNHSIDNKGRIFVPARMRDELGETFYVMPGIEACLNVYSREKWQRVQEKIDALPLTQRAELRLFLSNICECSPDKQGRFLLPAELRKYARLEQEITIIGQGDHAEIWASDAYAAEEEKNFSPDYMRAKIDELGI